MRLEPGASKGQGKWILRFVSPKTGRRRDMGLGRYPEVGIADAEVRAFEARKAISDGIDPIDARHALRASETADQAIPTLKQAAEKVFSDIKASWKNKKHREQWINTLRTYVFPKLGERRVDELGPADFAEVLRPIWLSKAETASRVKQRCHAVIKWCWAQGHVRANPLDVVDHLLPRQPAKRERVRHQPAVPWRDIPAFVSAHLELKPGDTGSSTRALLLFLILTASRSGEVRGAHRSEIDLENRVWTIPAYRMKTRAQHRIPLSSAATKVLEAVEGDRKDLIFTGPNGGMFSANAMTKFLRDHSIASDTPGRHATAHGFRSSFRDWASENGYARDLAERALAHTIANQSEAAYHRTDLLEQRRAMMEAWAAFVGGVAH